MKVIRAGPPIRYVPEDTRETHPMIVTLESPELAAYLHNYGRGWAAKDQYDTVYWVNPDLIQADRKAAYNARVLARRRRGGNLQVVDSVHNSSTTTSTSARSQRSRGGSLSSVSSVATEASQSSRRNRRSASRTDLG